MTTSIGSPPPTESVSRRRQKPASAARRGSSSRQRVRACDAKPCCSGWSSGIVPFVQSL